MTILNYSCCLALLLIGTARLKDFKKSIVFMDGFSSIFTMYIFVFSGLLFSAEYEVMVILKYLAFLASSWGKGLYLIAIGALIYDQINMAEYVASFYLISVGIANIIATCFSNKQDPFICLMG